MQSDTERYHQGEGTKNKERGGLGSRKAKTVAWRLGRLRKIIFSSHITDILLCIPLIYLRNSKASL